MIFREQDDSDDVGHHNADEQWISKQASIHSGFETKHEYRSRYHEMREWDYEEAQVWVLL